jgi:hypothetical protein
MTKDNNWILDELESGGDDVLSTLDDLKNEEKRQRQKIQRSKTGARGKRPVKHLKTEVGDRYGKRGPVVLMDGQGPKARTRFNVELTANLRDKLDRLTVGPRGHVAALLIDWALDELAKQAKCIQAHSVKL